jgi:hypothetical protein
MKRSAFLFAFSFSLLAFSSCTKDATYSSGSGSGAIYSNPTYMVASAWEQTAPNVFTSTLENAVIATPGRTIAIYARIDKDDVLINTGGINYENGYLAAYINGTNINITFRYFGADGRMPFSQLDIKVVYQ